MHHSHQSTRIAAMHYSGHVRRANFCSPQSALKCTSRRPAITSPSISGGKHALHVALPFAICQWPAHACTICPHLVQITQRAHTHTSTAQSKCIACVVCICIPCQPQSTHAMAIRIRARAQKPSTQLSAIHQLESSIDHSSLIFASDFIYV